MKRWMAKLWYDFMLRKGKELTYTPKKRYIRKNILSLASSLSYKFL
jgi:hypothetical protein